MNFHCTATVLLAALFITGSSIDWSYSEEPTSERAFANTPRRVAVDVARDRALTLHKVFAATLDTMHEHYFHTNRSVVPARALEDVFAEISEQSNVEARWISVNTPAMSLGHEPKSDFEKRSAEEIAAGKPSYERIEKGMYRRAGAILLDSGCVSCHVGHFAKPPSTPRFAGLVIGIPISDEIKPRSLEDRRPDID